MSQNHIEAASRIASFEGRNLLSAAKAVGAATGSVDLFGKPMTFIAEAALESGKLVGKNIGAIMNWTLGSLGSLLWGTLKFGGNLAMIAPLPLALPGGATTLGEVRGELGALTSAFAAKAHGSTRSWSDLMNDFSGSMDGVVANARTQATGGQQASQTGSPDTVATAA